MKIEALVIISLFSIPMKMDGAVLPRVDYQGATRLIYDCDRHGNICLSDGKNGAIVVRKSALAPKDRVIVGRYVGETMFEVSDSAVRNLTKKYIIAKSVKRKVEKTVVAIGRGCAILQKKYNSFSVDYFYNNVGDLSNVCKTGVVVNVYEWNVNGTAQFNDKNVPIKFCELEDAVNILDVWVKENLSHVRDEILKLGNQYSNGFCNLKFGDNVDALINSKELPYLEIKFHNKAYRDKFYLCPKPVYYGLYTRNSLWMFDEVTAFVTPTTHRLIGLNFQRNLDTTKDSFEEFNEFWQLYMKEFGALKEVRTVGTQKVFGFEKGEVKGAAYVGSPNEKVRPYIFVSIQDEKYSEIYSRECDNEASKISYQVYTNEYPKAVDLSSFFGIPFGVKVEEILQNLKGEDINNSAKRSYKVNELDENSRRFNVPKTTIKSFSGMWPNMVFANKFNDDITGVYSCSKFLDRKEAYEFFSKLANVTQHKIRRRIFVVRSQRSKGTDEWGVEFFTDNGCVGSVFSALVCADKQEDLWVVTLSIDIKKGEICDKKKLSWFDYRYPPVRTSWEIAQIPLDKYLSRQEREKIRENYAVARAGEVASRKKEWMKRFFRHGSLSSYKAKGQLEYQKVLFEIEDVVSDIAVHYGENSQRAMKLVQKWAQKICQLASAKNCREIWAKIDEGPCFAFEENLKGARGEVTKVLLDVIQSIYGLLQENGDRKGITKRVEKLYMRIAYDADSWSEVEEHKKLLKEAKEEFYRERALMQRDEAIAAENKKAEAIERTARAIEAQRNAIDNAADAIRHQQHDVYHFW